VGATAETPVYLDIYFDGRYVFGSLADGPYQIEDAYVYPSGDVTKGIEIAEVGATDTYTYTDFEPAAVVTGVVEEAQGVYAVGAEVRSTHAVDWTDDNGTYRLVYVESDSMLIRATHEGTTSWDICLNGQFVATGDSITIPVNVGDVDTLDFMFSVSGVPDEPQRHGSNTIFRSYPNPFRDATEIFFSLDRSGSTYLRIYDARGQLVRNLIEGRRLRGAHSAVWDGTDDRGNRVGSGVYFYELVSQGKHRMGRMTLLR
jgi:hypothetical protein